ncbi:carbohydrate-binding module family 50 protein [Bipolaris victoriae FI3]|uniref:Carbohydrate-binding module family 50 protein n=2 Tax=Bipolaris TaxID=33194 RepID=W7F9J8_BIPV3|nr:carbohydrate-binding module family 50 protein [Bipolaris victoriae FI3]
MVTMSFWRGFVAASIFFKFSNAQTSSPTGPTHPNIAKNCNAFHTVVSGDGCWAVETKYGISHANFIKWNPDVSDDCLTNFWLGSSYCVGVGALPSSSIRSSSASRPVTSSSIRSGSSSVPVTSVPSSTISSSKTSSVKSSSTRKPVTPTAPYSIREPVHTWNISSTTVETAFPPKKTQAGQVSYCNNWHLVSAGETCQQIVGAATRATMAQFLDWNPALDSDCSGLYDGWWVCIGIQPQSMTVTFDYTTTAAPVEVPEPTAYTPTTYQDADSSFVASPTQAGLASNCKAFHQAKDGETCRQVLQYGLVSQQQFFAWNPALNGNCDGLWLNYYYCVVAGDALPAPPVETKRPSSVPQNQISTCNTWYKADGSETCDEIISMYGRFSKNDLIKWNPTVGTNCGGIAANQYLCIGIPGTPTTRTTGVPSTTAPPSEMPTQSGMVDNCSDFWLVSRSDTCASIASKKGSTELQLLTWNPALGTSKCTNLTPNFYICVGVASGSVTTTKPTTSNSASSSGPSSAPVSSSATTSAGGAITTPSPTQGGMVAGCRRFYFVQPGDGCWAIANSAGIALNDFYKWNPGAGSDCSNLWLDTWYCIGIAGPVTTISSGPPVPT